MNDKIKSPEPFDAEAARITAAATLRKTAARITATINDNDIDAATAATKEAAPLLSSHTDRDLLAAQEIYNITDIQRNRTLQEEEL